MVALLWVLAVLCLAGTVAYLLRDRPNALLFGPLMLATVVLAGAALGDGANIGGSWPAHIGLGIFCLLLIGYVLLVLAVVVAGLARLIARVTAPIR